jgi:hypothetical protein
MRHPWSTTDTNAAKIIRESLRECFGKDLIQNDPLSASGGFIVSSEGCAALYIFIQFGM